jgi:hypothetical protein
MREMLTQFTGPERFPAFWTLAKHLLPRGSNPSSTDSTSSFAQQHLVGDGGDVEFRRPMSQRPASGACKYVLCLSHCGKVKRQRRAKHLTARQSWAGSRANAGTCFLAAFDSSRPQTASRSRPRGLKPRFSPPDDTAFSRSFGMGGARAPSSPGRANFPSTAPRKEWAERQTMPLQVV